MVGCWAVGRRGVLGFWILDSGSWIPDPRILDSRDSKVILDPRILDSRDSKVSGEKVAAQQSITGEMGEGVHRTPTGLEARGEPDRTAELAKSHGSETNDSYGIGHVNKIGVVNEVALDLCAYSYKSSRTPDSPPRTNPKPPPPWA